MIDTRTQLLEYRKQVSKDTGTPPFKIFTNDILEHILQANPQTMEQLAQVKGMGEKKVQRYGQDILNILQGTLKVVNY